MRGKGCHGVPFTDTHRFGKQVLLVAVQERVDFGTLGGRSAGFLVVHAAVPRVKNPGDFGNQHFPELWKTRDSQVLQSPVPVVVIVGAEGVRALDELLVGVSAEGHAHVVLGGLPRLHLHLVGAAGEAAAHGAVGAQGNDLALGALPLAQGPELFEDVVEVGRQVVVLFEEEDGPGVLPQRPDPLPDEMQLPPPVVLGLGEASFAVVPEGVGVLGVDAAQAQGGRLAHVAGAVAGVVAGEFAGVELDAEGEEDLQDGAEVHACRQPVELLGPQVVAQHQQHVLHSRRPPQRLQQQPQVLGSIVHLHHQHHVGGGGPRREAPGVPHRLVEVQSVNERAVTQRPVLGQHRRL